MHRPLDRTAAAATRLRHRGVPIHLLGLVLLCAAWVCMQLGCAVAANDPPADACTASAGLSDEATSASVDSAMAERGAGRGEDPPSHRAGDGPLVAPGVTESNEEVGASPASHFGRFEATSRMQAPRRRDPIVELCCVLIAPPRAPPAVARTAD